MDQAIVDEIRIALETSPTTWRSVSGGDVSEAFDTMLGDGRRVFVKTHADPPDDFFATEAAGLDWLRDADVLPVPVVLAVGDDPAFLVLEWIDEGSPDADTEAAFGHSLAALHAAGAPAFGREDRRTTGSRGLPNEPCETWVEFFATQRLIPLARLARDEGALEASTVRVIDRVIDRLEELGGDPEPPARLHGDLWTGNRIIDAEGQSWLIDPASHGGHREFDLAMMRLFGGFGDACFAEYATAAPLSEGWEERIPLHQLAPLVVHAVKFGGSYVASVERALAHLT